MLGVVGLVYAAWTTNGSGNGYAKAGAAVDLSTVDVSAETTGDLYPNSNGTVKLNVHNPNPYPVTITDVTAGSGDVTATDGIGTCETTGVSFLDQHDLSINVGADSDSGVIELAERGPHVERVGERLPERGLHDPGRPVRRQQQPRQQLGRSGSRAEHPVMALNAVRARSGLLPGSDRAPGASR